MGAAGSLAVDLSPVIGAFRVQLSTTFPAVIEGLDAQLRLLESTGGVVDDDVRRAAREAREQIRDLEADFERAEQDLATAEADARRQAARASSFQRSAAEAQRLQAQLALQAAESRADQLVVTSPLSGRVEFTDRQASASPPGTGAFGDLGDLGSVGGFDVGGLLGGALDTPAVSALPLAVGEQVRSGETLLAVNDVSSHVVRLDVDELDVIDVAEGQRVHVVVDALPGTALSGVVAHIAQTPRRAGPLGASYAVTVRLDPRDDLPLRIGLTASAEIEVERRREPLTVPTTALLRRGDRDFVRMVVDGTVQERAVQVLLLGDERAAIDGPVEAGDRVVTDGLVDVADGDRVRDLGGRG